MANRRYAYFVSFVAAVGGFHSGRSDISEEHDRELADAFDDWHDK